MMIEVMMMIVMVVIVMMLVIAHRDDNTDENIYSNIPYYRTEWIASS